VGDVADEKAKCSQSLAAEQGRRRSSTFNMLHSERTTSKGPTGAKSRSRGVCTMGANGADQYMYRARALRGVCSVFSHPLSLFSQVLIYKGLVRCLPSLG